MKVAIIMDPPEIINIDKDTTFALAMEARKRGFRLWHVSIEKLMVRDVVPWCRAREIEFQYQYPCHRWLSEEESMRLEDFDYVLVRTDPPFDDRYFYATHILSLCKKTKVVNNPRSIRDAPEKMYSLNFPEIIPPAIISSQAKEIRDFMEKNGGEIIIKPLDRCGGYGVVCLNLEDKNFNSIIEMSTLEGSQYIVAQKYLPEVRQGDKRVICVNGEPCGAIRRIPAEDEHRGNIHVGGRVELSDLTERDKWLIDKISGRMREEGLYFVGLDIIGDYITEINVTSPTGVQEIFQLGDINIAEIFWDRIDDAVFHNQPTPDFSAKG